MNYWEGPRDCCEGYLSSEEEMRIRDCFRLLWVQHVYWTRMVILGIAFNSPDLNATTNRLLQNATDFGKEFRRFYGKEIGTEFEDLVRDHLVIAAELVKAAKAGNAKAAANAEKRWYENADEIVRFLRCVNPYWKVKKMRAMWYEHLALTKQEAVEILNSEYDESISTFGRIEKEALMMADHFSNGIIYQLNGC